MWLNNSGLDAVNLFWERAGEVEPFPRTLERSILLGFPVVIIKLPKLTVQKIETWLLQRGAKVTLGCSDRAIRGCLVVRAGSAFIFVDGTDAEDQQRFTLAHEMGHYLAEYWMPRDRAIKKLGHSIGEVFDGLRSPTASERIAGILTGTKIGTFVRLMDRNDSIECSSSSIWDAENQADKIGLSILAPSELVLGSRGFSQGRYADRVDEIVRVLTSEFGLPTVVADRYGRSLLISAGKGPSWIEKFM